MQKINADRGVLVREAHFKKFVSPDYNYVFSLFTGAHVRWGKTPKDDPQFSRVGPELLDLEITSGKCKGNCPFCYKSNGQTEETKNMSLETFKKILDLMPEVLTQIAFGICDIYSNPDFFKMMEYCRENDIIPNYTTSGLDLDENAVKETRRLCGAVAVSIVNQEAAFDAVKRFTDSGMRQVNIHYMLSEQTYDGLFTLMDKVKTDARLKDLRSIVCLKFKPKGKGTDIYTSVKDPNVFGRIIDKAREVCVGVGFDSCSAPTYLEQLKGTHQEIAQQALFAECCESGLFSSYINCEGMFYPCSFMEGVQEWKDGINVLECKDFITDLWEHPRVNAWRERLLSTVKDCDCRFKDSCRKCPVYK